MILFNILIGNPDKGLGPTQAKLRELKLKEDKKKTAATADQRRLGGSSEIINESHPKVWKFEFFNHYFHIMIFRIQIFQLIQEIIHI